MSSKQAAIVQWVSIAGLIAGVMLLMRALPLQQLQSALQNWLEGLGVWGPIIFAVIYMVATVCLVPGVILTLIAGAIFGLGNGYVAVSVGSVVGASLAFLIARYLARAKVETMARSNQTFGAIDDAIAEGGWKIVALLRLSPAIPFNLQNYLYGLTNIGFWPYFLASWIGMIPGTFMYVYLGHVAGVAATSQKTSTAQWVLLGVGLLATIVVTAYITYLAKQKLKSATDVKQAAGDDDDSTSDEDHGSSGGKANSTKKAVAYAVVGLLVLGLGIFAQFQTEQIAALLEPLTGDGGR